MSYATKPVKPEEDNTPACGVSEENQELRKKAEMFVAQKSLTSSLYFKFLLDGQPI